MFRNTEIGGYKDNFTNQIICGRYIDKNKINKNQNSFNVVRKIDPCCDN